MRPDQRRLRTFVTIAREGSFTRASEVLNQPQPWISKQLKDLEEMLGAVLIERVKGQTGKLTVAGEALLPAAIRFVASCDDMACELRMVRDHNRNKLVMGVEPISLFIPRRNGLMSRFLALRGIDLELVSRTPAELFEGLQSGQLDLILTSLPVPDPGIETLEIHSARLDLAYPPALRATYAGGRPAGVRLLTMPEAFHPTNHRWVKAAFEGRDIEWVICPETSYEAIIRYAVILEVATVTPDFSGSIPELSGALEMAELVDPELIVRWALMRRRDHPKQLVQRLWNVASDWLAGEPVP